MGQKRFQTNKAQSRPNYDKRRKKLPPHVGGGVQGGGGGRQMGLEAVHGQGVGQLAGIAQAGHLVLPAELALGLHVEHKGRPVERG